MSERSIITRAWTQEDPQVPPQLPVEPNPPPQLTIGDLGDHAMHVRVPRQAQLRAGRTKQARMLKVQSPTVSAPLGRSTYGFEMVVLPLYAQPSEPDGLEPHAAQPYEAPAPPMTKCADRVVELLLPQPSALGGSKTHTGAARKLRVQSPSVTIQIEWHCRPPRCSTNGAEKAMQPQFAQPPAPDRLGLHTARTLNSPPRMHVVQEQREVRSWKDRGDRMEAGKEGRGGEGTTKAGVANAHANVATQVGRGGRDRKAVPRLAKRQQRPTDVQMLGGADAHVLEDAGATLPSPVNYFVGTEERPEINIRLIRLSRRLLQLGLSLKDYVAELRPLAYEVGSEFRSQGAIRERGFEFDDENMVQLKHSGMEVKLTHTPGSQVKMPYALSRGLSTAEEKLELEILKNEPTFSRLGFSLLFETSTLRLMPGVRFSSFFLKEHEMKDPRPLHNYSENIMAVENEAEPTDGDI